MDYNILFLITLVQYTNLAVLTKRYKATDHLIAKIENCIEKAKRQIIKKTENTFS